MLGKMITKLACLFSAIGAVNWGLVAFTPTRFDLVLYLANVVGVDAFATLLYGVIALSGVYVLISMFMGSISCEC